MSEGGSKYKLILKRASQIDLGKEDRRLDWDDRTDNDPLRRVAREGAVPVKALGQRRFKETTFGQSSLNEEDYMTTREIHKLKRLNWKEQKAEVLVKYTTTKNIPVHSKIIEDEVEKETKILSDAERARRKLEQLDDEGPKKSDGMSYFAQSDLISHLETLATELESNWNRGEKVKALRIVIQACKLLSVIRVPHCYPSLFVLTAKVLDVFGSLVYDRIYQRAVECLGMKSLPDDFKPQDLTAEPKDMCRNWFYKIASIRELIPRILVEMALWKCNRFIEGDRQFFSRSYKRFAMQIRGIGDPLLAIHARWYLCHKGYDLDLELGGRINVAYAEICFSDFLYCRPKFNDDRLDAFIQQAGMTRSEYVALFSPVVRWLIELVAFKNQSSEKFMKLLQDCKENGGYGVVMEHLIGSFDAEIICDHLPELVEFIETTEDKTCTNGDLWFALGAALTEHPPAGKQEKLGILHKAWEVTSKQDVDEFMKSAGVWVEYSVAHLGRRDVNQLLSDILKRLSEDKSYERQQKRLQRVLVIVMQQWQDFGQVFALDAFLPLLDMLSGDAKREFCFTILTSFNERASPTSDDVLIGSILDVCRTLHDPLTALSTTDANRRISLLIQCFMDKVDYKKDYEAQLNFYAECRGSFHKLQSVIEETVHSSIRLLQKAVRGHSVKSHTKKVGVFVKTCLTFCHITIPSIRDNVLRASCFMTAGYIATSLGFLSQGDLLLTGSLEALSKGTDEEVREQVAAVLPEFLRHITIASSADKNGLWLIRDIVKIVADRKWDQFSNTRGLVLTSCIQAAMPLYSHRLSLGEDDEADLEFNNLVSELTELAMVELKRLSELLEAVTTPPTQVPSLKKHVASISLSLFTTIVGSCEMFDKTASLVKKLVTAFSSAVAEALQTAEDSFKADDTMHGYARIARAALEDMTSSPNPKLAEIARSISL